MPYLSRLAQSQRLEEVRAKRTAINHGGVIFYIRNEAINVPVALMKPHSHAAPSKEQLCAQPVGRKKMKLRNNKKTNKRGCVGQKIKGTAGREGWRPGRRACARAKEGGRASSALYRLGSVFRCSAQRSAFQAKLVRKRTQLQLQRHRHVSRGWRTIFFAAPQHLSSFTVTRKGRSKPLSALILLFHRRV